MAKHLQSTNNKSVTTTETHEQLISFLIHKDKNPLLLKYISKGHAFFESMIKYPRNNNTFAEYLVTSSIPLTHPMFNKDEVFCIHPSVVANNCTFTFICIKNKQPVTIR